MTEKATIVRNKDRRKEAEMVECGVKPPQLYVLADEEEHGEAIDAVAVALAEEPNATSAPRVKPRQNDEWGVLSVIFHRNELPVIGDDGSLDGLLPPYRAEENFRESLIEALPDGYTVETQRKGHLIIAEE